MVGDASDPGDGRTNGDGPGGTPPGDGDPDGTGDGRPDPPDSVRVTVVEDGERRTFEAERGTTLRDALLAAGHSPYTAVTGRLNCGGRGICATCGVRLLAGPPPDHWHDRLADRFGYPRLSCQVRLAGDVTVEIPEKLVWGRRRPGETAGPQEEREPGGGGDGDEGRSDGDGADDGPSSE